MREEGGFRGILSCVAWVRVLCMDLIPREQKREARASDYEELIRYRRRVQFILFIAYPWIIYSRGAMSCSDVGIAIDRPCLDWSTTFVPSTLATIPMYNRRLRSQAYTVQISFENPPVVSTPGNYRCTTHLPRLHIARILNAEQNALTPFSTIC